MKAIQPITWCGMQKLGPDSPMVCGACPDPQKCIDADTCSRATAEDYTDALRSIHISKTERHNYGPGPAYNIDADSRGADRAARKLN